MKNTILIISLLVCLTSCRSQNENEKIVGGPCEGCEAVLEYGDTYLSPIDTLPTYQQNEPKIKLTGTVYQRDEKTPAEDVILYVYHTDRKGIYATKGDETGWARRHGYIRGWIKTGKNGVYTFYSFRPSAYPGRQEPEHIHITIKEPNKNEYYIDAFVFNDDPLLTYAKKNNLKNRGGSGIVMPTYENGQLIVKRDIILGFNIPDYK